MNACWKRPPALPSVDGGLRLCRPHATASEHRGSGTRKRPDDPGRRLDLIATRGARRRLHPPSILQSATPVAALARRGRTAACAARPSKLSPFWLQHPSAAHATESVSAWLAGRDGCAAMSVDYAALTDFARPFSVPLLDAAVNVFYTSSNTEEVRAAPRCLAVRRCSVLAARRPRAGSARAVTRFEEGLHLPPGRPARAYRALALAPHAPLAAHGGGAGDESAARAPGHVAASRFHSRDKHQRKLKVFCAAGAPLVQRVGGRRRGARARRQGCCAPARCRLLPLARSPAACLLSERARLQPRAAAGALSLSLFWRALPPHALTPRASPGARERDQVPLDVAARRAARGHQELHRDRGDKGASACGPVCAPGARTRSARSLRRAARCRATRLSSAATEHTSTS